MSEALPSGTRAMPPKGLVFLLFVGVGHFEKYWAKSGIFFRFLKGSPCAPESRLGLPKIWLLLTEILATPLRIFPKKKTRLIWFTTYFFEVGIRLMEKN